MTTPTTPFDLLFAQLSQGMSAADGGAVVNEVSTKKDAEHTTAERVVWIPRSVAIEQQHHEIPGAVTPWRQACSWDVSIYGDSLDRALEIHSLLVAWLDILVGPPQGGPPSQDGAPAVLRGTTNLAALVYPYAGLTGLSITVTAPGARALAFSSSPCATPMAIIGAFNVAAQAATGPVSGVRARMTKGSGTERYLELLLPANPLGTTGPTLTIDPDAANSACAALGFSAGDDNITNTGTAPTVPYRPGYLVEDSEPGPRGGDLRSQGWGLIVPVTLYRPIVSIQDVTGVVVSTQTEIAATGGSEPDEIVVEMDLH